MTFQEQILQGIPEQLPELPVYDSTLNHPPKRKEILNEVEKKLAISNALRYFDPKHHPFLAKEFAEELKKYGRIYMYRFRPQYAMYARPIHEYPGKCEQAKAIMHMIQNNLDVRVAQHPHELITYGGNGAVFQNWAQYLLTMQYLSEMTCEQTLVMYSGHPMGLFPSHKEAPRVVVTNGMMIPNYSQPDDWEKFNALGVTQYGQMTAGSYMYIGPQGIVHGTTITVLNAMRKLKAPTESLPLPIQRRGEKEKGKFTYMTARPSMYKLIKEFKEQNANNPTQAEKMLWESLKNKQLDGFKFRRQHIIDEFIVDFVCLSQKLVIEVDGKYHNNQDVKEYDILRTELLNSLGFTVIRFSNDEIIGNHESVLLNIKNQLIQTSSPLGMVREGLLFVTSGLGGMSGAQPKAGNIAGCITVCAEVNPKITHIRHDQKWVDEIIDNLDVLVDRVIQAKENKEVLSIAYLGNVVEVWEKFDATGVKIDLGSDQTSLHNPWAGGYYPVGMTFEEANRMMAENPSLFKEKVQASLRRHVDAINKHTAKGTYFFDYGNAFLLEAGRAGADVMNADGSGFKYPSYVEDIMGPMCFDYGFGPFRWVCTSADPDDLAYTDQLATEVLERLKKESPAAVQLQMDDNIQWIKGAQENNLVVGSQARILYADAYGRIAIAQAFNKAVREGGISAPIVLGRDHHDVSGTDSPYRETSNIYDGSRFTADMAIQNVIGDSFRGATWVSIHNGGGVGWGEVINGGFGMVLDGSTEADHRLKNMLFWDVNNGIARRSWARNEGAVFTIQRAMQDFPALKVTLPQIVADELLDQLDY
jgi:urocanate hydratase